MILAIINYRNPHSIAILKRKFKDEHITSKLLHTRFWFSRVAEAKVEGSELLDKAPWFCMDGSIIWPSETADGSTPFRPLYLNPWSELRGST